MLLNPRGEAPAAGAKDSRAGSCTAAPHCGHPKALRHSMLYVEEAQRIHIYTENRNLDAFWK